MKKSANIFLILLTIIILWFSVSKASYTDNQPQSNVIAPTALSYIRNNLHHYYEICNKVFCYYYATGGYYAAGMDTSDPTNIFVLKPMRVLTSAQEAATTANTNSVDHSTNAAAGYSYFLNDGVNYIWKIFNTNSNSYEIMGTSGSTGSISGTRVDTWVWGQNQLYSYISQDYVKFHTSTSINLQQWGNIITPTVNYKPNDGLTITCISRTVNGIQSITGTQYLTIDNHQVLRTAKRRDIPISGYSLSDTNPPEVSQTRYMGMRNGLGAYNSLLFQRQGTDTILFDFTVPADVSVTQAGYSDIWVDVIYQIGGQTTSYWTPNDTDIGKQYQLSGTVNFNLYYTPFQPISMHGLDWQNAANHISQTSQITNTTYVSRVSRYFPKGRMLTQTTYIMPLTISANRIGTLSEVYCTLERMSWFKGTTDTYEDSVRLLGLRVHGLNKNPDVGTGY